jgi:hypothetical protein
MALCTGYLRPSYLGSSATKLLWNQTATRPVSPTSVPLYTTAPWVSNATKTSFLAALYTGSAEVNCVGDISVYLHVTLFVLGWVMM